MLLPLAACGGDPPQIVDYAPQRGAVDVATSAPIRITFDHDVDKSSVESRFHLSPAITGSIRWLSSRQLVYEHATLDTNTSYDAILEAGYRDPAGNVYMLRHHWSFVTEAPPSLTGSTPADSDAGVDPSSFLTLQFTRQMNPLTLRGAVTIAPTVPFSVQLDPSDSRRAIISPLQLLASNTAYTLALSVAALDVDGNQLDRNQSIAFTTGDARPLRHWITFTTQSPDGTSTGLWIVNESSIPRQLFGAGPVHAFSWAPDGVTVLVQGDGERWWQVTPGAGSVQLTFTATWAAALAAGMGFVYLDDSAILHRLAADGSDQVIAAAVTEASVSPDGLRLAFVEGPVQPNVIWGYDVSLRARYQLAVDTAPVSGVTWAPAGDRIAYLRSDLAASSLRVLNLSGSGATSTVASGEITAPSWFRDSTHLVFAAAGLGSTHKAYVINIATPLAQLNPALGLPADPTVDVVSPEPSPDGHQIAFLNSNQVWLMNADGTRPTALTKSDPDSFPYSCLTPAWTSL